MPLRRLSALRQAVIDGTATLQQSRATVARVRRSLLDPDVAAREASSSSCPDCGQGNGQSGEADEMPVRPRSGTCAR
jgi:hypothetical protein